MSTEMERLRRFLAGEPGGEEPVPAAQAGAASDRDPARSGAGERPPSPVPELARDLDAELEALGPNAWRLRTTVAADARHGSLRLAEVTRSWRGDLAARFAGWERGGEAPGVEEAVFFDTECLGLSIGAGNVAFLVGLAYFQGERLICDQLLLDDFDGEPHVLAAARSLLVARPLHVSFNGKSFDLPLLASRFRLSGQSPPESAGHWDLLHTCRSLWAHALPDARLATLERRVVCFERRQDIPSSLVPEYYRLYLHERRSELLRPILRHNRWDLVSLAVLAAASCEGLAGERAWGCDPYGQGRLLERWGRRADALDAYLRAVEAATEGSARRLRAVQAASRLLKRLERHQEAVAFWRGLAAEPGAVELTPLVELAKHFEHRAGDAARALAYVEEALERLQHLRAAARGQTAGLDELDVPEERPQDETSLAALLYRRARLEQRLAPSS